MPLNVKVAFLGFLMKISEQFKKVQIFDFFTRIFSPTFGFNILICKREWNLKIGLNGSPMIVLISAIFIFVKFKVVLKIFKKM